MSTTKINWAGRVWPFLKGCKRLSEGCDDCYAIRQAHMRASNPNPKISAQFAGLTYYDTETGRLDWTGAVNYVPEHLHDPLHVQKPDRWFVNSLADLFYDEVDQQVITDAFAVMACCPQHVFLPLTKRHGRMRALLNDPQFITGYTAAYAELATGLREKNPRRWGNLPPEAPWPIPNMHLGVSTESQKWWDIRVPALLDCRDAAGKLWVSAEPLIGGIDMRGLTCPQCHGQGGRSGYSHFHGIDMDADCGYCGGYGTGPRLVDWIVAGGESGPRARPCEPEWLLSLRDQCEDSGVPFWMKQTGTVLARQLGLPAAGEDWDLLPPEYQVRELPRSAYPTIHVRQGRS